MFSKNKLAKLIEKSGNTLNEQTNQTKIQKLNLVRLPGNSLSLEATTLETLLKLFKVSPSSIFDSEAE